MSNLGLRLLSIKGRFSEQEILAFSVTAPLLLSLAGGRSLARVKIHQVLLVDIFWLLAMIFAVVLIARAARRIDLRAIPVTVFLPLGITLFALLKLLLAPITIDALREAHPYLYLASGTVVGVAVGLTPKAFLRIPQMVFWALLVGWALASLRMLQSVFGFFDSNPILAEIFRLRPDFDGFIFGLIAAVICWRKSSSSRRSMAFSYILIFGLFLQVALTSSRAAVLATMLMVFVSLLFRAGRYSSVIKFNRSILPVLVHVITLFLLLVVALAVTDTGQRLEGGLLQLLSSPTEPGGPSELYGDTYDDQQIAARVSGAGTVSARFGAWQTLIVWLTQDWHRMAVGVGFGTDYFFESGTRSALMGDGEREVGENRWPHNFALSTALFLGFPAAAYLSILVVWAVVVPAREAVHSASSGVERIALVILCGITVISLLGVVFENPFGSSIFAWSIGVAFAQNTSGRRLTIHTLINRSSWKLAG